MPTRKHGKTAHHKTYKGPWPEEHSGIPGRAPKTGKAPDKSTLAGHPNAAPIHKIPPQTPK